MTPALRRALLLLGVWAFGTGAAPPPESGESPDVPPSESVVADTFPRRLGIETTLRLPAGSMLVVDDRRASERDSTVTLDVRLRDGSRLVDGARVEGRTAELVLPFASVPGRVFLHGREILEDYRFVLVERDCVFLNGVMISGVSEIGPDGRPTGACGEPGLQVADVKEIDEERRRRVMEIYGPITRAKARMDELAAEGREPAEIERLVEAEYGEHVEIDHVERTQWDVFCKKVGITHRHDTMTWAPVRGSAAEPLPSPERNGLQRLWADAAAILNGRVLIISRGVRLSIPPGERALRARAAIDELRSLGRPLVADDLIGRDPFGPDSLRLRLLNEIVRHE